MDKLVDMKRTAAEKKAEREQWDKPATDNMDDYPYGLTVRLDHAAMEKLGMVDTDFDAGEAVTLCAECFVSEDSVNTVGGKKRRSMTLQLRKIALSQGEATDVVGALYGKE